MTSKVNKSILIFCVFAFGFFISNLLRSITATLTPVLTTEFDLTAGNLGLLAGGYFRVHPLHICWYQCVKLHVLGYPR